MDDSIKCDHCGESFGSWLKYDDHKEMVCGDELEQLRKIQTPRPHCNEIDEEWEDCGDGRLITTLIVNGISHHLEAIEVHMKERTSKDFKTGEPYTYSLQEAVHPDMEEYFDHISAAFKPDGPFQTVEINGKNYAVFASPHC